MNKLTKFLTSAIDISPESACIQYLADEIEETFGKRPKVRSITQYIDLVESIDDPKGIELIGHPYGDDYTLGYTITSLENKDIVIKYMGIEEATTLIHELLHTIDAGDDTKNPHAVEGAVEIATRILCDKLNLTICSDVNKDDIFLVEEYLLKPTGLDTITFLKRYFSEPNLIWVGDIVKKRFASQYVEWIQKNPGKNANQFIIYLTDNGFINE